MEDMYAAASTIPNYTKVTELTLDFIKSIQNKSTDNMSNMFNYMESLKEIPKLELDTSECANFINLFRNCKSLEKVDLSWITTTAADIFAGGMFKNCESLESLDFTNFDTKNFSDMSFMFENCNKLREIIGVIDMSNCKSAYLMFHNADKLKGVHLKNVPKNLKMFGGKPKMTYIIDNYLD